MKKTVDHEEMNDVYEPSPNGIITVKELRELLLEVDGDMQVVLGRDDWYVNVGKVVVPQAQAWADGDSTYSCFTIYPGAEFDARQL